MNRTPRHNLPTRKYDWMAHLLHDHQVLRIHGKVTVAEMRKYHRLEHEAMQRYADRYLTDGGLMPSRRVTA